MTKTVWLTGVSGAGKTTTAHELSKFINNSIILDADVLRSAFWPELGLSPEDRSKNVKRIGALTSFLAKSLNDTLIIVACIAPYKELRSEVIKSIESTGTEVYLVYLTCPLEERIKRDPKGLYQKALVGEIQGLTGYDGVYEEPDENEYCLKIDTLQFNPYQIANKIIRRLDEVSNSYGT